MKKTYSVVRRFGYFNVIDDKGTEVARFNGPGAKAKAEKHAEKFNDATETGLIHAGRGGAQRGGRGRGGQ